MCSLTSEVLILLQQRLVLMEIRWGLEPFSQLSHALEQHARSRLLRTPSSPPLDGTSYLSLTAPPRLTRNGSALEVIQRPWGIGLISQDLQLPAFKPGPRFKHMNVFKLLRTFLKPCLDPSTYSRILSFTIICGLYTGSSK